MTGQASPSSTSSSTEPRRPLGELDRPGRGGDGAPADGLIAAPIIYQARLEILVA